MENLIELRVRIVELLKKSNHVLIAASGPDGDSVGSAGALYIMLKKLGKEVTVVAPSLISEEFEFLPCVKEIKDSLDLQNDLIFEVDCANNEVGNLKYEINNGKLQIILSPLKGKLDVSKVAIHSGDLPFDLMITVDTGDRHQLGKVHTDYSELFDKLTVINIDHHKSNGLFGDINYVDPSAASTTQLLYPILEDLQGAQDLIDADIATLLLAGLISDTGSFVHSNVSPEAFKTASKFLAKGARQQEIIKNFYKTKPLAQLKLWGNTLNNLQFDPTYKIAWSSVTQDDLKKCDANLDHAEGIIDELLTNVPGTLVALLLKEKEEGLISGSLRSTTDTVDVSRIAQVFNGGGHIRAAGFRYQYEGIFADAEKYILDSIRNDLSLQLNISDQQKKQAPEKIQKLSIEINGQRYDLSEQDIKEMALQFLISEKKLMPQVASLTEKNIGKKEKDSTLNELKEGQVVDLKKYYEFDDS